MSDLVRVMSVTCELRRSGPSTSHPVPQTWIGLSLTGVFSVHSGRDELLVHPGLAVVFPRGFEYQMSHPNDDGDTGVALGFSPGLVEEALPNPLAGVRVTCLDIRMRWVAGLLLAAIDRADDALRIDEMTLDLLRAIARRLAPAPSAAASAPARVRIDRVRTLMAERPEARWTLESLARAIGYSPFHLAHQFRAYTGSSVHQYLSDLRAAAALRRIEAGDPSLAAVAVDLGFAHHSHLTATLRRRLGLTPHEIRQMTGAGSHHRAGTRV